MAIYPTAYPLLLHLQSGLRSFADFSPIHLRIFARLNFLDILGGSPLQTASLEAAILGPWAQSPG